MRSSFVSAVSHELKTPLTAIRMFAETLLINRSADTRNRDEYLDTIVNESERLTRLLNNVLDFSKIEQGTKRYRLEPQSLPDIVRSAARAMKYSLEQQGFTLRTEIDENVPPVQVDRDAIEQAVLNLLANAIKYSGDSRRIDLRLRSEDGTAVIEVSDRGVGIDPAEHARIFERFYRVPGPETDRIPGTGLGLTLVRHIAEGHDGRVTVTSAPGEGSTFSLVLPLRPEFTSVDDKAADMAERSKSRVAPGGGPPAARSASPVTGALRASTDGGSRRQDPPGCQRK
jgi:two-component system phosphate regulon sensor histidine kinase PhoR